MLDVIVDMYANAKSCVKVDNECSGYFQCLSGVRQGENLSPLLFAVYLNDLQAFIFDKMEGTTSLGIAARNLSEDVDENAMLKMFLLLYADDTVVCAESAEDLQKALDAMSEYCDLWKLKINVNKTKVVVFSRGEIRNIPRFEYGGQSVEVVFGFQYLGIYFNYNNKFNVTQKKLYDKASRAMFALVKKCRKLMLPLDLQLELFDRMIVPILLYGCEVWCPTMTSLASKLQLRFYKIIFKLNKSTPTRMVYGELGQFPLEIQAKSRMLSYWFKLVNGTNSDKFSSTMYNFLYNLFLKGDYQSHYLITIRNTLNDLGLPGIWTNQFQLVQSEQWFKLKVTRCLKDQYIQQWLSDVDTNELFYNYRLFKNVFQSERYLLILPQQFSLSFLHFRTLNHRLPIQRGRFIGVLRKERVCNLCNNGDIGDEFHYVFQCNYFNNDRNNLIPSYYRNKPNVIKFFELFTTTKKKTLIQLARFLQLVMKNV